MAAALIPADQIERLKTLDGRAKTAWLLDVLRGGDFIFDLSKNRPDMSIVNLNTLGIAFATQFKPLVRNHEVNWLDDYYGKFYEKLNWPDVTWNLAETIFRIFGKNPLALPAQQYDDFEKFESVNRNIRRMRISISHMFHSILFSEDEKYETCRLFLKTRNEGWNEIIKNPEQYSFQAAHSNSNQNLILPNMIGNVKLSKAIKSYIKDCCRTVGGIWDESLYSKVINGESSDRTILETHYDWKTMIEPYKSDDHFIHSSRWMDWSSGDFGDAGSCFMNNGGLHSYMKDAVPSIGGTIRVYEKIPSSRFEAESRPFSRDHGLARFLFVPVESRTGIVFKNFYNKSSFKKPLPHPSVPINDWYEVPVIMGTYIAELLTKLFGNDSWNEHFVMENPRSVEYPEGGYVNGGQYSTVLLCPHSANLGSFITIVSISEWLEDRTECSNCGRSYDEDEIRYLECGDPVCEGCYDDEYYHPCAECEENYEDENDLTSVCGGDRMVCSSCLQSYTLCEIDDEYWPYDNTLEVVSESERERNDAVYIPNDLSWLRDNDVLLSENPNDDGVYYMFRHSHYGSRWKTEPFPVPVPYFDADGDETSDIAETAPTAEVYRCFINGNLYCRDAVWEIPLNKLWVLLREGEARPYCDKVVTLFACNVMFYSRSQSMTLVYVSDEMLNRIRDEHPEAARALQEVLVRPKDRFDRSGFYDSDLFQDSEEE